MKQFHPDLNRTGEGSDTMIRRVIQAYEVYFEPKKKKMVTEFCLGFMKKQKQTKNENEKFG